MSEMTNGIFVTFEKDVSLEYANEIAKLLTKIRYVANAVAIPVDNWTAHSAKTQVASAIREELVAIYDKLCKVP